MITQWLAGCTEYGRSQETLVDARRKGGADVYGTSAALEKQYLRLTSAPAASAVRPPAVLERALQLVKDNWLQV